jgi:hypothetical protein
MKWLLVLLLGTTLMLGVVPAVFDQIRPPRTDVELARTARAAVELAREASQQGASRRGDSTWQLTLVLGTSVPLVIAYMIWRAADRHDPGSVELLAVATKHGFLQLPESPNTGESRLLTEQKLEGAQSGQPG